MKELTFDKNRLIVSKTDTKGRITYGNTLFLELSGYAEKDILGAAHNIIRHPQMPRVIFRLLWSTVQKGKEINAYVINRSKNDDFYWVFANVTPSFDKKGKIVGYYSVRRKPSQKAMEVIKPLYDKLLQDERIGGMERAQKTLDELIEKKGGRYDKFILSV